MDYSNVENECRTMKDLEQFDTPTITNAVATYAGNRETCLGLYHPFKINWYTNQNLRCLYPELGARCAHVVTVTYTEKDPVYDRLEFLDLLKAVEEAPKPVILAMKQCGSDNMRLKNALLGGNMLTALKQLGVIGALGDGPVRDIEEMKGLDVQCLFPGVTAGHGTAMIAALNTPISISGMDVCPGEIIHMDQNGAVKFPRKYLGQVLERARLINSMDRKRQKSMSETKDPVELAKLMKAVYA